MNYIIPLRDCNDNSLTAKALNLKKMQQVGLSIPITYFVNHESIMSFLVTIKDFDKRFRKCALTGDKTQLQLLQRDIVLAVAGSLWKKDFNDVKDHNNGSWIIRSAFGSEDGNNGSLAGNFVSKRVLELSSENSIESFKEVVASFFEPAAFENVLAHGVNPLKCRFGIMVQEYIEGIISGVGYSRDPNNLNDFAENPQKLNGFVEWAHGGCEAITSGDSSLLSSSSLSSLSPLKGLHAHALKLEQLLKSPVDFEWTYDGKTLWWLQARPIASEACLWALGVKHGAQFTRESIAERFPNVLSPMGWSLVNKTMQNSLKSYGNYAGIEFKNTDAAAFFYKGLVYANKKYYTLKNCRLKLSLIKAVPALLSMIIFRSSHHWNLSLFHRLLLKEISDNVLHDWKIILEKNIPETYAFDCSFVDEQDCLEKMKKLRELGVEFFKADVATHFLREAYQKFVVKALVSDGLSEMRAHELCAEFPENITMTMHRDLEAIRNADDSALLVKDFLAKHGHITMSWDVAHPTLKENDSALLSRPALRGEGKGERQDGATKNNKQEQPLLSIDKSPRIAEREIINECLRYVQSLARADEEQHYYAGLHVSKARELLLNLASHWQQKKVIENIDDIFYLTIDEVENCLSNQEYAFSYVAQRRRGIWKRYANESLSITPIENPNGVIQGIAASPGCAKGAAYFANDWNDLAAMPHNAILCLKTPNPSYVPWFNRCSAVVTENGAVLSHGFIAARELLVPAVTGIQLQSIKQDQIIFVDGNMGKIIIQ